MWLTALNVAVGILIRYISEGFFLQLYLWGINPAARCFGAWALGRTTSL